MRGFLTLLFLSSPFFPLNKIFIFSYLYLPSTVGQEFGIREFTPLPLLSSRFCPLGWGSLGIGLGRLSAKRARFISVL